MITRSLVLHNAQHGWPYAAVPYNQSTIHKPDGYRQDCSGFVSMCWGIMPSLGGGPNTVALVTSGLMHEIKPDELKPADAVGRCGPGTSGNDGHIQLFVGWLNTNPSDSHYYCLEQAGGGKGPVRRLYNWPSGYKAYRFRDIVDDPVATPPAPPAPSIPFPLPAGQCYGDINGPSNVHGGYYVGERPNIIRIQAKLNTLGFACGATDGIVGPRTVQAIKSFQRTRGLTVDGLVGPATWARLFS